MKDVAQLSVAELRAELKEYGVVPGPIAESTRRIHERKLLGLREASASKKKRESTASAGGGASIEDAGSKKKRESTASESSAVNEPKEEHGSFARPMTVPTKKSVPGGWDRLGDAPKDAPPRRSTSGSSMHTAAGGKKSAGEIAFDAEEDAGGDDDHLESSRILMPRPQEVQKPYTSTGYYRNVSFTQRLDPFSRPAASRTPCSRPARASEDVSGESGFGGDAPGMLVLALVGVIALLAVVYVCVVNRDALAGGVDSVKGWTQASYDFLFAYTIVPTIVLCAVLALAAVVYFAVRCHRSTQDEKKQQAMALVERVTDLIRQATTKTGGIAEHNVRDLLMPPTKRTDADWELWEKATRFINDEDSRVRTETRLKDGVESKYWVWS